MFSSLVIQIIVVFLVIIVALILFKPEKRPHYAFLFLGVYLVARIVNMFPLFLDFHIGLKFNWIGHLLIIAWVLIFIRLGPLKPKDIGLTLEHRTGTIIPAVKATLGIIIFKGILAALVNGGPATGGPPFDSVAAETLIFQITMPPLAQELLFSGLLLSLIIIALGGRKTDQEFEWNQLIVLAIIVTAFSHAIRFGLVYNTSLQFRIMSSLIPFIGKTMYSWLRLYTGSLVFPVLAFSTSNFVVWLVPYLLG